MRVCARAAAPETEALEEALTSFPFGVADYLIEARRRGLTFDQAWTPALDKAAKEAGYKRMSKPWSPESALVFAKRHFRAAYEGADTAAYCVVTSCVCLTDDPFGLCDLHDSA